MNTADLRVGDVVYYRTAQPYGVRNGWNFKPGDEIVFFGSKRDVVIEPGAPVIVLTERIPSADTYHHFSLLAVDGKVIQYFDSSDEPIWYHFEKS